MDFYLSLKQKYCLNVDNAFILIYNKITIEGG